MTPTEVAEFRQKEKGSTPIEPEMRARVESAKTFLLDQYKRRKLTWPKLAGEIEGGYDDSSLNLFATGKYPGNPQHILEAVERYRELLDDRAANVVHPDFVETSIAKRIVRAIRQTRSRGRLGIMAGDSGIGKSETIRWWRQTGPASVYLLADPTLSYRPWPLIARLLLLVGSGDGKRSSPAHAYTALVEALVRNRRTLIVDEAQFISRQGLDVLRCLHEAAEIPIFFAGNETLYEYQFLSGSSPAAFTQFVSRCSVEEYFKRTDITLEDVLLVAGQIVSEEVADEAGDMLLSQAHSAGGFRQLVTVLQRAHEVGKGKVTAAHIAKVIKERPRRGGAL